MRRRPKGEGFPGQRIVVLPRDVVGRARQHPLLQGLLPTDVGFFPKARDHGRERRAGVEEAIFIYCTKGQGWCEMAGGRHTVRPGDLLVVPPRTPHGYGADPRQPWTISWLHAVGWQVPALLQELGATAEAPVLYLGDDSQCLALFEELLEVLEQGYAPAHLLYASHTLGHLLGAMIWHARQNWRDEPDLSQKIGQTIAYMKQHLDQPLRVPALANLSNLSASHFAALFHGQTGYAPIDYFIRLRMHKACQLLDTTALSVKEVAARVGYEDPLYFSRAFRRVNRCAPTEYRDKHKG